MSLLSTNTNFLEILFRNTKTFNGTLQPELHIEFGILLVERIRCLPPVNIVSSVPIGVLECWFIQKYKNIKKIYHHEMWPVSSFYWQKYRRKMQNTSRWKVWNGVLSTLDMWNIFGTLKMCFSPHARVIRNGEKFGGHMRDSKIFKGKITDSGKT